MPQSACAGAVLPSSLGLPRTKRAHRRTRSRDRLFSKPIEAFLKCKELRELIPAIPHMCAKTFKMVLRFAKPGPNLNGTIAILNDFDEI